MKKITSIILCVLMISNSQAIMIQAEETPDQFIKVTEQYNGFRFKNCIVVEDSHRCSDILGGTIFTRLELNNLSDQNARRALYATAGGAGAVVVGFFAGFFVGSVIYTGTSVHATLAALTYGAIPGTVIGISANALIDTLDPFIYRDTSLAFDAITGIADEDDLEDVDAYRLNDELVVVIEDIDFNQLEERLNDQLADLRNMEVEDF